MASKEGSPVLGDEGARAGAQNSNLGLDILNVIVVGFEIDLVRTVLASVRRAGLNGSTNVFDCDSLPGSLVDSLVHDAKASTCRDEC